MTGAPTSRATTPAVPGRPAWIGATVAALVGIAVHLWGLYRDHGPPTVPWFPQADKLEHLVGFGLPCLLVLLALHLRSAAHGRLLGRRAVGVVVALFVLHAGVSEIVQGELYTTRSGDPLDALADVVGTALGLAAYVLLVRRRVAPARLVPVGPTERQGARGRA